jgi:Uma2 family endonuclease
MVVQEKLYTADDLWELSQQIEGRRLELIEGEISEMTPAGGEHGVVAGRGLLRVGVHVENHQLGYVTAAETGYILFTDENGKDTVLAPDVGFVSKERAPDGLPEGFIPFAPDLAVEVVSPSETYTRVARKVALYLRYGTRMVWVIDPASKTVVVHTSEGAHTFGENDTLTGGDVLPGFTLPVRDIFPA